MLWLKKSNRSGGSRRACSLVRFVESIGFDTALRILPDSNRLRWLAIVLTVLFSSATFAQQLPYPILFVTQFPVAGDFTTIASVFGNHRGDVDSAGRGGDLYIRYPDGSLRNLTSEAGYGEPAPQQGSKSIAVRDPAVSWDSSKAIFSMVVGAPTQQYTRVDSVFQLYEVTGLGRGQTATIVKVPNQPSDRNNVSPIYLSDNSILFTSDAPRNGASYLYPQLDEYEEAPTVAGLWRLQPADGTLELIKHAVSGSFNPIVDSFGRIVFTRWDHLQRDQQNDNAGNPFGIFNYSNEGCTFVSLPEPHCQGTTDRTEIFPEPRAAVGNVNGMVINQFFPWTVNQDGTVEETLNHVGRHELQSYFTRSFTDDDALTDFNGPGDRNVLENFIQIREDPTTPGRFVGIAAPEFYTQGSGQIVRIDAAPTVNAAVMKVDYLNPFSDVFFYDTPPAPADFTGHFRNPLPLSDGRMIAAHTSVAGAVGNPNTPPYMFRLNRLEAGAGGYLVPVETLTAGISRSVRFWSPDTLISYNGPFWELSPVEVRSHAVPPTTGFQLQAPEQQAFTLENVDLQAFRAYLRANGLAVIVMRNVTTRDSADRQQPYNLHVPGGVQTVAAGGGRIYDINNMQFFQGDQIRGKGGTVDPNPGRRVLAQVMHDGPTAVANGANAGGPPGSVPIASDGSVALFVPAQRPLAWHSTSPTTNAPVVRERYWISFAPGEIRACDGCHGVNQQNQETPPNAAAQNTALALRALLARWRNRTIDLIFANGIEQR